MVGTSHPQDQCKNSILLGHSEAKPQFLLNQVTYQLLLGVPLVYANQIYAILFQNPQLAIDLYPAANIRKRDQWN